MSAETERGKIINKQRVVGYKRIERSPDIGEAIINRIARNITETINKNPLWECAGVFIDLQPEWTSFNEMIKGKYDLVYIQSIGMFEKVEMVKKIKNATTYIPQIDLYSTDRKWPYFLKGISLRPGKIMLRFHRAGLKRQGLLYRIVRKVVYFRHDWNLITFFLMVSEKKDKMKLKALIKLCSFSLKKNKRTEKEVDTMEQTNYTPMESHYYAPGEDE